MEGGGAKVPTANLIFLSPKKGVLSKMFEFYSIFWYKIPTSYYSHCIVAFSFVWCTVVPSSQPPTYTTHILYNGFILQENFSRMAGISVFREKEIHGLPLR